MAISAATTMVPQAAATVGTAVAKGLGIPGGVILRTVSAVNSVFDRLIEDMKQSPSPTVARSGRVFEAAKLGFGMGYVTSTVVITAGQWLLGNPVDALGTFGSAVVLLNPTVMTCAAMGAVVYGYWALNDDERNQMLETIGKALSVGLELIRSIIEFVIGVVKKLLNPESRKELKRWIRDAASAFNRGLGDITRKLRDKVADQALRLKSTFQREEKVAVAPGPVDDPPAD